MFGLWSSENQIVGVRSGSTRSKPITKRGNLHCDWCILPLLLPTPTIWKHRDSSSSSSSIALMTPLTTPTLTLLLVKTILYWGIQIIILIENTNTLTCSWWSFSSSGDPLFAVGTTFITVARSGDVSFGRET